MKKIAVLLILLWFLSLVKFYCIVQEDAELERLYREAEHTIRMERLKIPPWDILVAPSYVVRLYEDGKTERIERRN